MNHKSWAKQEKPPKRDDQLGWRNTQIHTYNYYMDKFEPQNYCTLKTLKQLNSDGKKPKNFDGEKIKRPTIKAQTN